MNDKKYVTMTKLAEISGVCRVFVRERLLKLRLLTTTRRPSGQALKGGFCRVLKNPHGVLSLWHQKKTIAMLMSAPLGNAYLADLHVSEIPPHIHVDCSQEEWIEE